MKWTTFILMIALAQVSAKTFSQKINLDEKNTAVIKVLQVIEQQSGFVFFYDYKDLKDAKVSVTIKDATINDALDACFKSLPLTYKIGDTKTIIIKPKEKTFLERVVATLVNTDASGRVVDSENKPLQGASVKIKKTGRAVSTDKDGKFFLRGVEEGAVLVISFIGYLPKEVSASANMGNVVLEQSLSKLDEVQVIAYGTTTRRLSTGNISTVKAEDIEKQPVNNPLLALQGRVPGLFIEQATGFAGTGVKVRIQGQNSINNGNDPLYVIDGVAYASQLMINRGSGVIPSIQGTSGSSAIGNPLSFINPADIESIDILKDADATAIYGSRAANGVILITTKKGKQGDTRVNFNLQSGWAKVPRKLNLMNSEQYLEMRREALRNDGIAIPDPGPYSDSDLNGNWDTNKYTDWQKELIGKSATYQDLNASVSGGNNRTTFMVGAGHHRETNVFPGDFSDNKTSMRFNISSVSSAQKFRIQFSGSYLLDNNQLPNIDLTDIAMRLAPTAPDLYQSDGSINWSPDANGYSTFPVNPIGYLFNRFINKTDNLMSNMTLSYQILPGLEIKSTFGYNKLTSNLIHKNLLQSVTPEFVKYAARETYFTNAANNSWSVEPQLTYHRNIGKGKLELLFGATLLKEMSLAAGTYVSGFSNDLVMEDILSGTSIVPTISANSTNKYNAAFGRINYIWQEKYLLNLTARRDGSSRFGPKSQFHNFASAAGAWIFSNEKLIRDYLKVLSFGKIKASYGTTGSSQIPDYQFLSLYNPVQQQIPYQGIVAYQANRLSNPNLEWEETRKLEFGLDLGFFKDRCIIKTNYYLNHSSNQLSIYTLPFTTGFTQISKNVDAEVKNSGWELAISSTNLLTKDFKWSTDVNFTILKTLLTASSDRRFPSTDIVGQPLSAQYVYHFLGVDPATGIYQFEDINGNPTSSPNYLDRIALIDLAPKFYGGIQNSLSYKGFQLDFLLSFVKQIALDQTFGLISSAGTGEGQGNQLVSLLDRWQKPGDISTIQRFSSNRSDVYTGFINAKNNSDAAWKDGSYIRLKNVSLSWQLPERWKKGAHLQNCNLYIQGQNLFTFTNYKGLDPETKSSSILPPLRVITIGLKVGL